MANHGAGLGLRRELVKTLADAPPPEVDFYEVAPENWIRLGGKIATDFRRAMEAKPLYCHGLSLSLGSPAPLDETFVKDVGSFLDTFNVPLYSEHLSYCSDDGHLYDLMPIPFTSEAVTYVAGRIRRVQDILQRRIAIENVSFYAMPAPEMDEAAFVSAVLSEADCDLLLDVNNIYVNSVNHRYDPYAFLKKMPAERVAYIHVAGHYVEDKDLIVDTHGADVIDPVWQLLDAAYAHVGVRPTLLERDFNIPPLTELMGEVATINALQDKHRKGEGQHAVRQAV
ncbi:MAG: DUF692 family protein [Proteobacteria bacterium]|nr:DUF692 family protein [Pseudomonadota bacterium]